MRILGISAFYHDSAAALVVDGRIECAVQEERFTRRKHDNRFPSRAIKYILREKGLKAGDIDIVAYYEKPFLKFSRIAASLASSFPEGYGGAVPALWSQVSGKLFVSSIIRRELGYKGKIEFFKHHESHAASAFYPSPFESAAILTVDGVGEWETTAFGSGKGKDIELIRKISFPHSIGLLYAAFTYFLGFKVNFGEYKVMGLAPYGEPKYVGKILDNLIDVKDDGSFRLNMGYFDYIANKGMINEKFEGLMGRKRRLPEDVLTGDDMDIARSIQEVVNGIFLKMAGHIKNVTGEKRLCLAGGVALNCVANGKVLKSGIFDDIWIQPASGDAGGALGAALRAWYSSGASTRPAGGKGDMMSGAFLGPSYDSGYIKDFLEYNGIPYERPGDIGVATAELLSKGNVIGWFSGRMEFGPRSLGARSIIGDPRVPDMQKRMNLKIKYRESFRPFAPAVLEEDAAEWFELDKESPYMLIVADVKDSRKRRVTADEEKLFGIDKLNVLRSDISSVTHVDYSARVQTVSERTNPVFYGMIKAFKKITGCPVIINTSFNVRGEPIVLSPEDAYRCFMGTEMDYLVLGDLLLDKKAQPVREGQGEYHKKFDLD